MVERVQRVRHITADADNFVGLQGEFTAVTDTIGLRVHDGVTPGGYPVVMQNQPIVGTTLQALATVQVGTQLYFGSDTTTYINSPAADEIGVSIGGSQKVLISATAFVIDETLQVITTATGSDGLSYQNLSSGVNARAEVLAVNDAGHDVRLGAASSGHTGPIFTNGPVGEQTYIGINLVGPLTIGQIGGNFFGQITHTGQLAWGQHADVANNNIAALGGSVVVGMQGLDYAQDLSTYTSFLVIGGNNATPGTSPNAPSIVFSENHDTDSRNFGITNSGRQRGKLSFFVAGGVNANPFSGNEVMAFDGNGNVQVPTITTTASAANAVFDGSNRNNMLRSVSSGRYKKNVRYITAQDVTDKFMQLKPCLFNSNIETDNQELDHYGLIAEDEAQVEPNLVTYIDMDGQLIPDGVQYDRHIPGLIAIIQQHENTINQLKTLAGIE